MAPGLERCVQVRRDGRGGGAAAHGLRVRGASDGVGCVSVVQWDEAPGGEVKVPDFEAEFWWEEGEERECWWCRHG